LFQRGDDRLSIRIAANYSPELLELLQAGQLGFLDYIKVPLVSPPLGQIRDARRFRRGLLHCWGKESIWVGAARLDEVIQSALVREMIELTETPYVSTHLVLDFADFGSIGGFISENARELVFEHLVRNILHIKSQLDRDLVLENMDFHHGRPMSPFVVNPSFISELLAEVDCKMLLDIGHAQVSAWHLGYSFAEYLQALPLSKVIELHVHAPGCVEGQGLSDVHRALRNQDYKLIRWLADHAPLETITLEYGGIKEGAGDPLLNDKQQLADQLNKLHSLVEELAL